MACRVLEEYEILGDMGDSLVGCRSVFFSFFFRVPAVRSGCYTVEEHRLVQFCMSGERKIFFLRYVVVWTSGRGNVNERVGESGGGVLEQKGGRMKSTAGVQ